MTSSDGFVEVIGAGVLIERPTRTRRGTVRRFFVDRWVVLDSGTQWLSGYRVNLKTGAAYGNRTALLPFDLTAARTIDATGRAPRPMVWA